jgi:hypothetical protein
MKMKNIFSKKSLTVKQKWKLNKLQLGIVLTLFLEIVAFSKSSHANSVNDYYEGLPKREAPTRLEQSSKSKVTLEAYNKGNPTNQKVKEEASLLLKNPDVRLVSSVEGFGQSAPYTRPGSNRGNPTSGVFGGASGSNGGSGSGNGGGCEPNKIPTYPKFESFDNSKEWLQVLKKKSRQLQEELDELLLKSETEVNEIFSKNNVKSLVKKALKNQKVKKEYQNIKERLNQGLSWSICC